MTTAEAAELLHVSVQAVSHWRRSGDLPSLDEGDISPDHIQTFVRDRGCATVADWVRRKDSARECVLAKYPSARAVRVGQRMIVIAENLADRTVQLACAPYSKGEDYAWVRARYFVDRQA